MKNHRGKERRKHPRVEAGFPLELIDGESVAGGRVENISSSGIYFSMNRPIPLFSTVKIALAIPSYRDEKRTDKRIRCEGAVVRTEKSEPDAWHIAVFFSEIDPLDREKIARYVESRM